MISKTTCPVCNFVLKEDNMNTCPHCKTDLRLWNQTHELPDTYYHQALQLIKANRLVDARERLIAALILYPQHPDAQLLLGKVYAELEMYNEAVDIWEKALTGSPQNSTEIKNLISQARKYQEEKQKPSPPPTPTQRPPEIGEKTKRNARRAAYSAVIAMGVIAAFILGWFLSVSISQPSKESPPHSPTFTAKPPDYTQKVKEILTMLGKDEFQVRQEESIIYLQGEVAIPQEKYEIEKSLQNQKIEGISVIDLSGITVRHPGGYYYLTREGDNLWKIAYKMWGNGEMFSRIFETNKQKIPDPTKISPGIPIIIPNKEPKQ
jgi:tetratricopeptide (TPR) repeat protein